jgi:hypothetical protein
VVILFLAVTAATPAQKRFPKFEDYAVPDALSDLRYLQSKVRIGAAFGS